MNKLRIGLILFVIAFILIGCKTQDPQKFTITFDTDGGSIVNPMEVLPGAKVLIVDEPTKEGNTFDWWYIDASRSIPFDEDEPITESITLYAKWILDTYSIVFQSNGGLAVPSATVAHGAKLVEPTPPTRNHYTFGGWYRDSQLTNLYDFNTLVSQGFTLYAKWNEITLPLVEEEDWDAYYIVTSFGEDSSRSVRINYQTKNVLTSLEITLYSDVDYTNKTIYYPEMTAFESLSSAMEIPFERRNVCRVQIDGLEPNTTYQYRINKGDDTYTDDYVFTTSTGSGNTSFLFITDAHYYDGYDGAEISEEVIRQAKLIQPNISFVLSTGDMIDTGGNSIDWHKWFTFSEHFLQMPHFAVAGNHEHYEIGTMGNRIFNAYFNFPDNGNEDYRGASYYFFHNDTLIIQMDTDSPYNQGKQVEWLDDVLTNNPAKFVILGMHAPINFVTAQSYDRALMAVLEKHAVDLVVSGHHHNDSFYTRYLDKAPFNSQVGVAYLNGAGSGRKAIGIDVDPLDFAKGYIIDVLDDRITIRYINARGNVLSTRTVMNKKVAPHIEATNEELIDSITANIDDIAEVIRFEWSSKFFKNVKSMTIKEEYRLEREMYFIFPTPGYTMHEFDRFVAGYEYRFTFTIVFADDSEEIVTFDFDLKEGFNLVADEVTNNSIKLTYDPPTGNDASIISYYEVYVNGNLNHTYQAKDVNDNFKLVTVAIITDLSPNTAYDIVIKAYGRTGYLYSDTIKVTTSN